VSWWWLELICTVDYSLTESQKGCWRQRDGEVALAPEVTVWRAAEYRDL
jgi:hypothetical protein